MQVSGRHRRRSAAKVATLYSQAERARKVAVGAASPLIAELFEIHARMCERNAEVQRSRRTGKAAPAGG